MTDKEADMLFRVFCDSGDRSLYYKEDFAIYEIEHSKFEEAYCFYAKNICFGHIAVFLTEGLYKCRKNCPELTDFSIDVKESIRICFEELCLEIKKKEKC